MTPAAALLARENLLPAAARPASRPRRAATGVVALLAATILTRLLWPDTLDVVDRAVAWSGSQSWKAWFFGTLDPQAATSVGAPAAGWLSSLLLRLSGAADLVVLSTVLTVLAVAVLAATVRRVAGPPAGLVAGAVLALLVRSGGEAQLALLLSVAGYCVVRYRGRVRWLLGSGLALGFSVLAGGWTGLVGLALLVGILFLRNGSGRWTITDVAVLAGAAVVPVGAWLLVAPWWPGGRPVTSGIWSGPVAGVLAPAAAAVLALGGRWLWQRWTTALRVGLAVALVLAVGFGASARSTQDPTAAAVDTSVSSLLTAAGTTWSAAAVGSPTTAAALELASGTAVLTLDPGDDATTLARFQSYVATGRVHYLVVPNGTASDETSDIVDWVATGHTATTVGTATVYDLTS